MALATSIIEGVIVESARMLNPFRSVCSVLTSAVRAQFPERA